MYSRCVQILVKFRMIHIYTTNAEFYIIIYVQRLAKQKVCIHKICIEICKNLYKNLLKVPKVGNIMLILCKLMRNSASKSANLCKILYYNSFAEVSVKQTSTLGDTKTNPTSTQEKSHYQGMRRSIRRFRIIYLLKLQNCLGSSRNV